MFGGGASAPAFQVARVFERADDRNGEIELGLQARVIRGRGPVAVQFPIFPWRRARKIVFHPSPCAEKVLFDAFGVSAELPLGKPVMVTVTLDKPGEYEFTCQMRMYRGTLVVR